MTSLFSGVRQRAPFLILFLVFLGFFLWNGAWHITSQLVMTGQTDVAVDAVVQWDSGNGFNDYESAGIVFGQPVSSGEKPAAVKIVRTGERHPSSRGAEVWIKAIRRGEDDHAMSLERFSVPGAVESTGESLHLQKDGITVAAPNGRDRTEFLFATNHVSGIVEIGVGEDRRRYDLYSPEDGERRIFRDSSPREGGAFASTVYLPRYDIRRLKISTTEPSQSFRLDALSIKSEREILPIDLPGKGFASTLLFSDVRRNTKQYFHLVQGLQQAIFAALCAWCVFYLFRFVRLRGGPAVILLQGKRPAFWLMLAGGLVVFSGWLFAYWPGHFTTDSVHIWWAAKKPGYFLFQHPVMNVIFYRFLQQFWNNFAIVGIFQIAVTAALGSYIFYFLYKNGVCLWVVLPCYLAFITSVPVGLYSITLWKDIPFALFVLTWAFYFVKAAGEKRGYVRFSRWQVLFLALLLFAPALVRYNGIVYLLLIPLGMVLFGMLPWRKVLAGLAVVSVIASAILGISIALDKTNFVPSQARVFLNRMQTNGFLATGTVALKQYPTILDINTYQKRHIWYDVWYRDRQVTDDHYNFAKKKGYNLFIRYEPCEPKIKWLHTFLDSINRGSHQEPWVYLTWNPFYMLFLFPFAFFPCLFPRTAAFGYVVLSQVVVLLYILGPYNYNWRYYYFLLLSLYFLIPVIALDVQCLWRRFRDRETEGQKGRWFACGRSA